MRLLHVVPILKNPYLLRPEILVRARLKAYTIISVRSNSIQEMIAKGEFLETASVYCNYYGTPKAPVLKMLADGNDVMFEIDTLGAEQIRKKYPKSITIFLMPPSFEELERRLRGRGTESEEAITRRLGLARSELSKYKLFDYIVFNDNVENAIEGVISIIDAEKSQSGEKRNHYQEIIESGELKIMMIYPPIDKLVDKTGCKYALVIATAKRAKYLAEKKADMLEEINDTPISYAAKEIYDGKVEIKYGD